MRHSLAAGLFRSAAAAAEPACWLGSPAAAATVSRVSTCISSAVRAFTSSRTTGSETSRLGGTTKNRDAVVRELDEHGREIVTTGPDSPEPRGSVWHQQTVEGAMNQDSSQSEGPQGPGAGMDRRSPGGPTAEDLDHKRPAGQGGSKSVGTGGPGAYVTERVKEAAAGVWETLKHGVMEELQRTAPQDFEAVSGTKEAAAKRQKEEQQQQQK
ncbi:hypothetical protein PLESTB_000801600 [Pleodorina starrii]|uniref:Uncharacterized protein n=1 Tax=Pleodorina starrii TaxID=330485 RepID=A0A9W6BKR2_9CHLO|nr:hypothetical protein PLESTM_000635600 [Pleodorina starrii]GLC53899.1 hypothetical protein PLESTB_000801600 [Pleodorina starrii]GLC75415.1 hypothetical protein PLESTF_001634400 [Pleodorina starrii]